jgi:hypothetical protein
VIRSLSPLPLGSPIARDQNPDLLPANVITHSPVDLHHTASAP